MNSLKGECMETIDKFFLSPDDIMLLIIDVQERLAVVMDEKDSVIKNTAHLIEMAKQFAVPVIATEQYPKGLGPTVPEIKDSLPAHAYIEKIDFDCCGGAGFLEAVKKVNRKKVMVAGMETHVCVLQTVLSLLKYGYDVHLVSDAVCSRSAENKSTALALLANAGAVVTCTETVLFQVLKKAGTPEFKVISKLIK